MTTANPTYRVRRALTEQELRVVIAGIEQASTITELLGGALRNILNPLLADIGACGGVRAAGRLGQSAFHPPLAIGE